MPIGVQKTVDNVAQLMARVTALTTSDVLVGVPADKSARKDAGPTNAEIARIHEFGSPAHNIPARPFLFPGIKRIRSQAMAMLKLGAQDALQGKGSVDVTLNKVGMLARNSVVNEITDPDPPFTPLAYATIRARLRRTAAGRRQLRKAKAIQQASDTGRSMLTGEAAIARLGLTFKPLIDTGALRASISYVVRKTG